MAKPRQRAKAQNNLRRRVRSVLLMAGFVGRFSGAENDSFQRLGGTLPG